jgi:hypothetical protein
MNIQTKLGYYLRGICFSRVASWAGPGREARKKSEISVGDKRKLPSNLFWLSPSSSLGMPW